jgi:hypothetical protein
MKPIPKPLQGIPLHHMVVVLRVVMVVLVMAEAVVLFQVWR